MRFALALAMMFGTISVSAPAEPASSPWADLASRDVSKYCADIRAIHPGMVDPLSPTFPGRVSNACVVAASSARSAKSYLDWRSVVESLVTSFRDGHTRINFALVPSQVRWPGFLIDGRSDHWVVRHMTVPTATALAPENDPPNGATLLACDGKSANDFLKAELDNKSVDWSKLPERIRQGFRAFIAPRLDGPVPAKSCRFEQSGKTVDIPLDWEKVSYPDLATQLYPLLRRGIARPIEAVFASDGHVWITIGNLKDETALNKLEATLKANQARLRAAPYVVFDMRNNGGGNSTWGERLAGVLWGKEAVEASRLANQPTNPNDFGKYWRSSRAAAAGMLAHAREFAAKGPDWTDVANYWLDLGKRANAAGRDGLMKDDCCQPEPKPTIIPRPAYAGKVFVLTDAGCFSSGVVAMNTFKRMGAVQVGEASGQNEVWGEWVGPYDLPSGLGSYVIPASIIRQPRSALGGFPPDIAWTGAMDDDQGLEKWIAALAAEGKSTVGAASH